MKPRPHSSAGAVLKGLWLNRKTRKEGNNCKTTIEKSENTEREEIKEEVGGRIVSPPPSFLVLF